MLPLAANGIGGIEYYSLATTATGVVSIAAMPLYGYFVARRYDIKRSLMAVSCFIGIFGFSQGMTVAIVVPIIFAAATLACALVLRPLSAEDAQG